MGNINKCGQCNEQHTQKCWQTKVCEVHQGICFSCRNCQTQTNLDAHCQICKRKENRENMFLHHECDMDQYLCNRQFIKKQYYKNIPLPCSRHQISSNEYINFMTNFCYQCGRMMVKDIDIYQRPDIKLCFACRKNNQLKDQKVQVNSGLNIQPTIPSQKKQQQNKATVCNIQKNTELEQKYQETIQTQKKVIQLLESDKTRLQARIQIYDFHLKQIQKIVGNQSQVCQLCMVPYDLLSKTPYQICMAQHIVCKSCLEGLDKLVEKKCPWCKEKIQREKVTAFPRLHKKIVEIQKVIHEKFQTTLLKLRQHYKQQINQIDQKIKQKQQPKVQKKEKKHKIIKKQKDQTLIKIPKIKKQTKKVEKKKV